MTRQKLKLLRDRPRGALVSDGGDGEVKEATVQLSPGYWWLIAGTAFFMLTLLVGYGLASQASYPVLLTGAAVVGVAVAVPGANRMPVTFIGTLALWTASALLTLVVSYHAHADQEQLVSALGMFVAVVVPIAGLHLLLWVRAGLSLRAATSELTRVFTVPKTGWAAALLGVCMAFPVVSSYADVITDTDSGWLANSSLHLRQDGFDILKETQNVFLPHLTLGPLLALDGYRAAVVFALGSMLLLCGLTSYLGYKMTDTGAGALVATVALLSLAAVPPAYRLPQYSLMFFFGYGAAWLLHLAMSDSHRSKLLPVAAGLGFVLAFEAHSIGQLFLLVPFLLLLIHPRTRALLPLAMTLGTIVVASVPRVLTNLSVDGTESFRSNYTHYSTQKYLHLVNQDLWGREVDVSPWEYLQNLPEMALLAVGGRGLLVLLLIPIAFAATRASLRASLFVVASAVILVAALAINSPAPFPRYLSPIAVGMSLVVACGVATMFKESKTTTFGWLFTAGLLFWAMSRMVNMVEVRTNSVDSLLTGPIPHITAAIDDDRPVVGVRSPKLAWVDPDLRVENHRTMSEADWITYLVWPNEEDVAEVLDRYDIGWVIIMPGFVHEVTYHQTWLTPVYRLQVNHLGGVINSDMLCLVTESEDYLLYRHGDCEPGDLGELPRDIAPHYEPYKVRYEARGDIDIESELESLE